MELQTWNVPAIEIGGYRLGINKWTANLQERTVSTPPFAGTGSFKKAGSGVDDSRLDIRYVGTRRNPVKPGLIPQHLTSPPTHRDHMEFQLLQTVVPALVLDHQGEFSCGHSVSHGGGVEANTRLIPILPDVPLNTFSSDRIGAIQNEVGDACFCGRDHGSPHRSRISVEAGTYILNVKNQHIHTLQHLGGGAIGLPVQAVDRHTSLLINTVIYMLSGIGGSTDAMFRTKQGNQLYIGMLMNSVDKVFSIYHSTVISNNTHSYVFNQMQIVAEQQVSAHLQRSRTLCLFIRFTRFTRFTRTAACNQSRHDEKQHTGNHCFAEFYVFGAHYIGL